MGNWAGSAWYWRCKTWCWWMVRLAVVTHVVMYVFSGEALAATWPADFDILFALGAGSNVHEQVTIAAVGGQYGERRSPHCDQR